MRTRDSHGHRASLGLEFPACIRLATVLLVTVVCGPAWKALSASDATGAVTNCAAIEPYVSFLMEQKEPAVKYILSLFDRYDLVVLCERAHPEITQYDLIHELIASPQFQREVGQVFTEIGSAALQPYVESLLTSDRLSETQVNVRLRYIATNIGWIGMWQNTSFYDLLKKVYAVNQSLKADQRVHVYPNDLEIDWEKATKETWGQFTKEQLPLRDKLIAQNVIRKLEVVRKEGKRSKALVIMNYRHAFPHVTRDSGNRIENTTGYLMAAFPGKVASVMLNAPAPVADSDDRQWHVTAIQEGKWDAAFAVIGNPDVGFDFKGSPFGQDGFDYFPFVKHHHLYQDMFTGFVFFKPIKEHRTSSGLPKGVYDQSVADALLRRFSIMATYSQFAHFTGFSRENIDGMLGSVQLLDYDRAFGKSNCQEKIEQWLKVP